MTGGQLSQATASRRSSCLRLQHGPKRSARRRERESSKGGSCRAGCWWNGGWERNSRCVGGWERWWMREGESTGRRSRPAAPSNATKAPSSHHPAVVMVRGSRSPPAAIPPKPRPQAQSQAQVRAQAKCETSPDDKGLVRSQKSPERDGGSRVVSYNVAGKAILESMVPESRKDGPMLSRRKKGEPSCRRNAQLR